MCEHPDLAVVPTVKEFYVNGIERDHFKVFVRGKWVSFDPTTINHFYGLEDLNDEEYHPLIETDGTNWDAIKDALCKDQVPWKRYANEGLKSFLGQTMNKISKIWHYFVCAKLSSITNFNVIMKNMAAFVYAIQENKKIDVEFIIQNSIIHGFQIGIQGFAHPHLIIELCKKYGGQME